MTNTEIAILVATIILGICIGAQDLYWRWRMRTRVAEITADADEKISELRRAIDVERSNVAGLAQQYSQFCDRVLTVFDGVDNQKLPVRRIQVPDDRFTYYEHSNCVHVSPKPDHQKIIQHANIKIYGLECAVFVPPGQSEIAGRDIVRATLIAQGALLYAQSLRSMANDGGGD